MALRKEISGRITDLLRQNPQGLSITEIVRDSGINRNTAGRYLDNLLVSGQVEMRHFGMAKIYTLSTRLPASSVLSLSSEYVIQLDSSFRVTFLNHPFATLIGMPEREIVGKNIEFSRIPLFFDDVFPRVLAWLRQGLEGTEFRGEFEVPAQGLVFSCRITPTVSSNGQKGVSVIFEDITEKRHSEQRLRESEQRLQLALSGSETGMWDVEIPSMKGTIDDRAAEILGYRKQEIGSMTFNWDAISHPEDVPLIRKRFMGCLEGLTPLFESEHRMRHVSGEWIWVSGRGKITHRSPEGAPLRITGTIQDITKRKLAENALRESENRYRSLAEASQDLIFVIDREDRVVYINQQAAAFIKKTVAEVVGKPRSTIFPHEVSARQSEALTHVFTTGQPVRSESPMSADDGLHWFDHALMPIPDAAGKVTTVLGVSRDITKRAVAEQERLQDEQNNRFIAEHSVDIIHRLTPDCVCTYTSPSVTALLGYAERDVLGKPVLGMIHPEDLPGVQKDILGILTGKQDTVTSTFRFRHKAGHYLWFESTTRIVRDAAGKVKEFISISRDITGRKN